MAIVSHKRKIISALLASVVSLATVGVSAIPAQAAGEQLTYDTDANNKVTITGCVGTCPEILVIPATLGGNPVTNIGDAAFVHTTITSVTIPNSVTTVGNYAFANAKLTSLSIPASVTTLGDGAFKSNELTTITVPSTVRNIGAGVFQSNQLTSATFLGDAPTTEFGYVFDGNPDLPYIVVPIGASGWNAIYSNTKVVPSVPNAPTGVVGKIGDNQAFVSWVAPTDNGGTPITGYRVTSNPGSQTCSTFIGISRNELRCVVTGLTNGTSYRFTVVAINLRGESIASRSSAAVTPEPDKFTYTTDAFDNVTVTGCVGTCPSTLVIPATLGDNPVTKISEEAFLDTRVSSVTIPTSVTSIGAFAFGNNQLTSLSIPASLTSIGSGAFQLNSLTTLTIPSTVTNFGAGAFQFNSLTSVTFLGDAPNDPNYMFDPTPPNPALRYIVVPVGALGWGEFYSGVPVYNINTIPTLPGAPTGVVGVSGPERITVSWVAPANTGGAPIRNYTVTSIPAGATCSTDELACTITGLTKGSIYTFSVVATNLIGSSGASVDSSSVTVNGRNQEISFTQIADRAWSNQEVSVTVSSKDADTEVATGLDIALASTTSTICTVDGFDVTTLRPGTCTLQATQLGSSIYEAATQVTMSFQVLKAAQVPLQVVVNSVTGNGATATPVTLNLGNASNPTVAKVSQVLGFDSAATVSANLQSLQPISSSTTPTFSVLPSDAGNCTVSSEGMVAIAKIGNCRVRVQAPADDFYLASGQQLASDPVGVLTVWITTVAYVSPEVNFGDGSGVNYTKGGKITPTFMSKFVGSFTYVISFTDKSKSFSVMGCPLNQYKDKAKKICKTPQLVPSATCTLTSVRKMTGKEFTTLQPFKFGSCQINAAGLAKLKDENIAKRPKIAMRADFRPVWPVNGKVRAKSQKDGKYYTAIPRKGTRVFNFG